MEWQATSVPTSALQICCARSCVRLVAEAIVVLGTRLLVAKFLLVVVVDQLRQTEPGKHNKPWRQSTEVVKATGHP